jgi:tetratricopeptide (TPR) repeat protein
MVKKMTPPSANQGTSAKPSAQGDNAKKLIVLISMILIGILIIAYKTNVEYWSDQFIAFNQYLFGASIALIVLLFIVVFLDLKRNLKREFIGTLVFSMGALIISLFYARIYFSMDALGENGVPFIAIGAVLMVLGSLFLMRTGGFIGASLVGLIILLLLSAVHMMDTRELIQFDNNAIQLLNLSIICIVVSFMLLVYNDLKFFYLAKLIQEERKFRKKKDYKTALVYCEKAIRIYPNFATAWNNKGNVLVNLGKKKDALQCYKKALDINPNYKPAMRNIKLIEG